MKVERRKEQGWEEKKKKQRGIGVWFQGSRILVSINLGVRGAKSEGKKG